MKVWNLKQKENFASFFRETSVAFISIGGISTLFDKSLQFYEAIFHLVFSLGIGILLLITSSWILKR